MVEVTLALFRASADVASRAVSFKVPATGPCWPNSWVHYNNLVAGFRITYPFADFAIIEIET
jgi:hypothetical protein